MSRVYAPFTPEQIEALTKWQNSNFTHPFTCINRSAPGHEKMDPEGDWGVLVATEDGWICRHCDYTQKWAHDYMVIEKEFDFIDFFRGNRG